jgi:hypothetical protein
MNIEQKINERQQIPANYHPIKLDSLGLLSAPKVLHFRDYVMEDIIALATLLQKEPIDYIERLLAILTNMNYEKFDCMMLHDRELKQILLTLYFNWGKEKINRVAYRLDESQGFVAGNIGYYDIPRKSLETIPINTTFTEPINITYPKTDGVSAGFRLRRVGDDVIVKRYIDEVFFNEDREFSDYEQQIKESTNKVDKGQIDGLNEKIKKLENAKTPEMIKPDIMKIDAQIKVLKNLVIEKEMELKATPIKPNIDKRYKLYAERKLIEAIKASQALLLVSYEGKLLETFEEKLEVYDKLNAKHFIIFQNNIDKKYSDFGVVEKIRFKPENDQEYITRRFEFRYSNYLPEMELSDDDEFDISFG